MEEKKKPWARCGEEKAWRIYFDQPVGSKSAQEFDRIWTTGPLLVISTRGNKKKGETPLSALLLYLLLCFVNLYTSLAFPLPEKISRSVYPISTAQLAYLSRTPGNKTEKDGIKMVGREKGGPWPLRIE
jgi:hypothetical protein